MSAPSRLPIAPSPAHEGPFRRDLPHTAGFADALGGRQLLFDPASSTSLEVLRFRPEFGGSPEFEWALRGRVEELSHVQHPSLASIHSVERVDEGLFLVSKHTPGRRVSELLPKAHGPEFALELIRLVTPALAALQRVGDDVAHGVISAERVVVTRDGRLVVVEHVLGSAIEALDLPRQRLIELGLAVPAGNEPVRFSGRTDIAQLGFIALSLLLGRRLDPADYPEKVPALLDEFARTAGSPMIAAKLRVWLERALQVSPKSFASAREAQAAFGDLPTESDVKTAVSAPALVAVPAGTSATSLAKPMPDLPEISSYQPPAPTRSVARLGLWLAAGLALVAAGGAAALFVAPYLRPATEVIELRPATAAQVAPTTPPLPQAAPATEAAVVPPGVSTANVVPPATGVAPPPDAAIAAPPAPAGPRFGGITVSSPMELQVFEDGKLLGSTAGPIAVNEGRRNVEFVNESTGFRLRQTIAVRGGQMTTVNIAVPNGRISINAVPWAEVDVDGKPAGETPIANLSLPIGAHEIVFRHPQLGTRKQTVVVKVDGLTRVTQTFGPGLFND